MQATMMSIPMSVQMIMRYGARHHAPSTVASFDGAEYRRATYADVAERAARLGAALQALGVERGDRVATYCWNHQQHLEAYLAVPSIGAVLHTLNTRLFGGQIAYIADHADDRVLIADAALLPQLRDVLPHTPSIKTLIVVGSCGDIEFAGATHDYEDLIARHAPLTDWPELDENMAAAVCYTSGTTGNPKGVVYSHKTIFVHSLASMGVDTFAISQTDRILLLPPMFHANAWGLPYSGWFAGSAFVMPGAHLQPDKVRSMIASEKPTFTAMVPTLLNDLLRSHQKNPLDMSSFRVIVSGGSPVSAALIERVRDTWNLPVIQGWGMTETSPLCALSVPPAGIPADEESLWRAKSGRPVPGVEVRILDDSGKNLPHDGKAVGALQLRGPWIARGYHRYQGEDVLSPDGWLRTGDVGTIDSRGYVQITDRMKDIIKSGGEWISSAELEGHLARHPSVSEVAVIGVPDPRWEERPLAVIVTTHIHATGKDIDPAALRAHLAGSVAKFWLPEYWAFVPEIPKTSVGKIDKRALREMVAGGQIAYSREDAIAVP